MELFKNGILKDLVISTAVIVGECSCEFDIDAIYSHLEITNDVLKLKCNNKEKTKTREIDCKTFYNQISISLKCKANIKLFNNGKFQISGVKNVDKAKEKMEYIFGLIENISGTEEIKPAYYKGLAIYKNRIITKTQNGYICSNMIKNEKIIINSAVCDVFDQCEDTYIQNNHEDKVKKLYNSNCEEIGRVEYVMIRKNKNLCLKGSTYMKKTEGEYVITSRYGTDIGIMKIHIHGAIIKSPQVEKITITYNACSQAPKIVDIKIANVNSNTKFIMGECEFLDRDLICDHLRANNINFVYDPCRYAGIKFTYNNAKITIFRTGSILFSSKDIDTETFKYIRNMFTTNNFIRQNKEDVQKNTDELTIWDI